MTTPTATKRPVSLSGVAREIFKLLALRVLLVTVDQIANAFWPDLPSARRSAERHLSRLVHLGVVKVFKVRAHRDCLSKSAIWSWVPGEPEPPYGILSYQVRRRWTEALQVVPVYTASARAARLCAGHGGRLKHPLQATHDLHVSSIYFQMLKNSAGEAARWVSEDALRKRRAGGKIPDAEIHDASGRVVKVIEFAGSYAPERLRLVHEDCVRRQVPYELW